MNNQITCGRLIDMARNPKMCIDVSSKVNLLLIVTVGTVIVVGLILALLI